MLISALILAAGLSRRMGTNKLLLPFGEHTVLEQVVSVLQACPLEEMVVVTGHQREQIEEVLSRHGAKHGGLRFIYNTNYAAGDMLSSIQAGLAAMRSSCNAALIALGDQPHIKQPVVEQVIAAHAPGIVVIPSFNRRGGHPILIDRTCWPEILALPYGASLRDLFHAHTDWLRHVDVDTETILRDLDTPEDYRRMVRQSNVVRGHRSTKGESV